MDNDYNTMDQEGELFERAFVAVALDRALMKGWTKKAFSIAVFHDENRTKPSAARTIYAMMGTTASKRPQRLTMREAFRMARLVGDTLPELCSRTKIFMDDNRVPQFLLPPPDAEELDGD